MLVQRAYKFRLYPDPAQERVLAKHFGCRRFVYNHFLETRHDRYKEHGEGLSYADTCKLLTALKRDPGHTWLNEVNAQVLQQALRDLDTAFNNFFAGRANYPHFKHKRGRQSFRVPQSFRVDGDWLVIPKVSPIKMVVHRPIEGRMKHVTISRTSSGKYFASILCEVEMPQPEYQGGEIGLDLGLTHFLTTSEGEKVEAPRYLRQSEKRLRRLQRRLSGRQKGSGRREEARLAVARQYEKVVNQRADFLHKLSRRLVDETQVIWVEDLNVKGLLANHCLAKSIADAGWSEFTRMLEYKGKWYGCGVSSADRFFPSSRRCHVCGHIHRSLCLSDRRWVCPVCRTCHDRDENAATNLLHFGRAGTARTYTPVESWVADSRKPEAPPLAVG